jgi:hypothetical protein
MAAGISAYLADSWLDSVGNGSAFSVGSVWLQLHVGDPGAAGTSNPAVETARKAVSFAAASGGVIASDADVSWVNIQGSEDATFFTAWDSVSGGNFLFSGAIVAGSYQAGDTYTISAGALSVSLVVAS